MNDVVPGKHVAQESEPRNDDGEALVVTAHFLDMNGKQVAGFGVLEEDRPRQRMRPRKTRRLEVLGRRGRTDLAVEGITCVDFDGVAAPASAHAGNVRMPAVMPLGRCLRQRPRSIDGYG
jgi:hypothetical protein